MPNRNLIVRPGGDQIIVSPPIIVPPPPPPPPSGLSPFRTYIGASNLDEALWGVAVTPDSIRRVGSFGNGQTLVEPGGWIDQARGAGNGGRPKTPPCRLLLVLYPGNDEVRTVDGFFSPAIWKQVFTDGFLAGVLSVTGGLAKLRSAVADGTILCGMVLDDYTTGNLNFDNAFARAVSYSELEDICKFVKVTKGLSWLPLMGRAPNTYHKQTATLDGVVRQYSYLDCGFMQHRFDRDSNPTDYINLQWAAGEACALGGCGGANMLNGGLGTDPAWRERPGFATLFGMSPDELRTSGYAFLADRRVAGWNVYSYGINATATAYYNKPEILAALLDVYTRSVGRNDGLINIRGDLVAA